jgi:hypothetical protein
LIEVVLARRSRYSALMRRAALLLPCLEKVTAGYDGSAGPDRALYLVKAGCPPAMVDAVLPR